MIYNGCTVQKLHILNLSWGAGLAMGIVGEGSENVQQTV